MANKIVLTFVDDLVSNPIENKTININIDIGSGTVSAPEVFRETRLRSGQIAIPDPATVTGLAQNYSTGWYADQSYFGFTGSAKTSVTYFSNTVTITLLEDYWSFLDPTGTAIADGNVTWEIIGDEPVVEKSATITSYSESASDPCTKVNVNIYARGGTELYNVYVNNVLNVSNKATPITVNIDRGVPKTIKVTDNTGVDIDLLRTSNTRRLIEDDIEILLTNFSSGTTITVTAPILAVYISEYEYSLDGINFQESNVFTGQLPNTYTVYVRDGVGCITSKSFVVDGVTTVTETVFDISDVNPLRYARIDDNKKNHLNTLSKDSLRLLKYEFVQEFLSTDVITTQFKTNGAYIDCFKLFCDGTTQDLTPIQKTENIGVSAKTTCTYFNLENGLSAIYFGVVESLNYLTGLVEKEINYGSALPQWANEKGKFVTIDGIGELEIYDKVYSDEYSSFVAVFNLTYTGEPTESIVSSVYNIQPYEIYEFETTTDEDDFHVVIQSGTDSDNIDFTYISEKVRQVKDSEFLFEIKYWDDENKGKFNYQTDVKNTLRLKGYQDYLGEQTTSGYNGDNEYYITDNEIYDVQQFTFNRLSTQMAAKLRLVMSHKYLVINGLYYKLSEAPEVSGDGNYNLKKFIVTLKHGGEKFLTDAQEIITDSSEQVSIRTALESAKGKGLLLWTKNL